MKSKRQDGFTLIELMIVVTIIATIAVIAVPNLLSSRLNANEAAAIATLKNIASAQELCRSQKVIDTNGNGMGEHGFFAELSGATGVRNNESGGVGSERVTPPALSGAFGNVQGSRVLRSGYYFQIYLPSSTAAPLAEAPTGGGSGVSVYGSSAEYLWCCYAWPATRNNSGNRTFFINQGGDIFACRNNTARYSGTTTIPAGTAAAIASAGSPNMATSVAANATGQDGERWLVVN